MCIRDRSIQAQKNTKKYLATTAPVCSKTKKYLEENQIKTVFNYIITQIVLKALLFPGDFKIFKAVWFLAFPVIISNLSRVIMSLVDVAMVGHLGPEALAATGMGGMLAWGALSIVLGIRTSVQTITSRRLGQNMSLIHI